MYFKHSLTLVAAVLTALPVSAFEPPEDGPLRQKTFSSPEMYIASQYLSETALVARGQSGRLAPLVSLRASDGGAQLDPRSGRWGTLTPATPLVPGTGNTLSWNPLLTKAMPSDLDDVRGAAWSAYRGWLDHHAADLGLDLTELGQEKVTVHRGGELIQIHVPRVKHGLRVRDSYLHAVLSHGNLVLWGAVKWGDLETPPAALFGRDAALQVARAHVAEAGSSLTWKKAELLYVPVARGKNPATVPLGEGYDYRLVWSWRATSAQETGEWEALVDAQSGNLLRFVDRAHYAADPSESFGAPSAREMVGGVYPVSNDGVAPDGVSQTYPMPFATVTDGVDTWVTDSAGQVPRCVDGSLSTTLDGPYVTLTDTCGQLDESSSSTTFDLGTSGGIDCTVPGGASPGNTHAGRSGFYEINRDMEMGRSYLPDNVWLTQSLPVLMNIAETCNATGGPGGLRFYQSGGGCSNTGEIAGVFVHEWGHGMDGADATPGISNPGEGIADIYAALRLNTSCIGRNFRPTNCTGFGDPCTDCTGVRDIDFAKRQSGNPHDIAFIDTSCEFFNDGDAAPCAGSVHCEGAVAAESVWDLWKRDLPGAGIDPETAYRLTTRLTFEGAGATGAWYTCNDGQGTGDGCNADGAYLNYLAADDNDGNLANGTPHMEEIFDAFDRHGIACPTPAAQNSGCTNRPAVAPVVASQVFDRGVTLTWGAVADAVAYRVYKTEGVFGCDFGKIYLGETTELSFVDDELRNGDEYYYVVVPVGAGGNSCLGPASACTTVTPAAGANLRILPEAPALAIHTGDGDVFVDSCEQVTVSFELENSGTGSLTNTRIVSVSSPSHPSIDATVGGFGIDAAGLSVCGAATASFDFTAADVSFQDVIEFEVQMTSDEISPRTVIGTLRIENLESDFETLASKTFHFDTDTEAWTVTQGTFTRSSAVGGAPSSGSFAMNSSTLLNNQCDRIVSPIFVPTASTTMSLFTHYEIEDFGGDQWWDRANAATIDSSGNRQVVTPSSGRGYDSDPDAADYSGCNAGEPGWAGTTSGNSWASSSWSAVALGSGDLAGEQSRLELNYATDGAAVERGFAFDRVTLTHIDLQVEDGQANCSLVPIFSDTFETGGLTTWSNSVP